MSEVCYANTSSELDKSFLNFFLVRSGSWAPIAIFCSGKCGCMAHSSVRRFGGCILPSLCRISATQIVDSECKVATPASVGNFKEPCMVELMMPKAHMPGLPSMTLWTDLASTTRYVKLTVRTMLPSPNVVGKVICPIGCTTSPEKLINGIETRINFALVCGASC
ncbi:hypothetical protein HanRHA438_Chr02g0062491 [Helianthus annuus]|nr:hypothetical protein HanRHA438_Chr02g0062491 [Helianthus annuus]